MAPPPKYQITRNLIKRYFKKLLPNEKSRKMDDTGLRTAIKTYGIGTAEYYEEYLKFQAKYEAQNEEIKKFKELNIKSQVLSSLNRPLYKSLTRGKHRDHSARPLDIYDGIIQ